jgi:lysophospholipase L1-like esterase
MLTRRSLLAALALTSLACESPILDELPEGDVPTEVDVEGDDPDAPDPAGPTTSADAGTTDPAPAEDAGAPSTSEDAGVTQPPAADAGVVDPGYTSIGPLCFGDIFDPNADGPDYDQFQPAVGSHCQGTNHQDISGVERIVFVGDSVTVGTPPTAKEDYYRSRLAGQLAQRFGLQAPSAIWQSANPLTGTASVRESGDFASCAKWGARTDDLLEDSQQLAECIPEAERGKKHLVIMTIGGNDVASFTKDGAHAPYEETRADVEEYVQKMRDAVEWLTDPSVFPAGNYVVFSNMFEFTDGTGEVDSCAAAATAGFDEPWDRPEDLEDLVIWMNEAYMEIAVDTGTDMIFMLENFCGHGFNHDDPNTRCYRGPGAERWFDLTCIHPNPTGHDVIADMFLAVVDE